MAELSDEIHEDIKRLSANGDRLAQQKNFAAALKSYWAAWDLIPEPKTDWNAGTWLLAAIGDANFLAGDFVAGRDNLSHAMHCPGAVGNPFIHLRLGQCHFELGALDRAADELMRAYMGGGPEIFRGQSPKYYEHLRTKADDLPRPKRPWQFWK